MSLLFESNLKVTVVKIMGWKVWSWKLTPQWQVSNCYKTRSSSLPSRGGLVCAFHSYFLKQNDNKSSPRKVPWLERPFLLWLPGIKVVSILDEDGVMSRLVERCSLSLECSLLQTGKCRSQCCSINVFYCIIFNLWSSFVCFISTSLFSVPFSKFFSWWYVYVADGGKCVTLKRQTW